MRTQDPARSRPASPAVPASPAEPAVPRSGDDELVDVRGPRFSSAVTAVLLAVALVVQGPVGIAIVAVQVAVFAVATTLGVTHSPWARLFRAVRRRAGWGPATELESAAPVRFAQACGLVVAGTGLVLLVAGATVTGWIAVGIVLALATLLATSGLCVGCELWLLGQRLLGVRA